MSTSTRQKLEEAQFFLDQLESTLGNHRPPLRPEAKYFLNAFVSSARSVSWVMRAEFCRVRGWEEWFASVVLTEEEGHLLAIFNDLRVQTEKVRPLDPKLSPMIAPELVPTADGYWIPGRAQLIPDPSGKEPFLVVGGKAFWFLEVDSLVILPSCKAYLAFLNGQVDECEQKFAAALTTESP